MTHGGHGWRLAIRNKATGQVRYYRVEDSISIGPWVGSVASIDGRRAVFESAGEQHTLKLGDDFGKVCPGGEQESKKEEGQAKNGEQKAKEGGRRAESA